MGDMGEDNGRGSPIGRRVVLGMAGLGALGVAFGGTASDAIARALSGGGGGAGGVLPATGGFRYYSVTFSEPEKTKKDYRLSIGGLVDHEQKLRFADLQRLPATGLTRDFQCVTGWRVPHVPWSGVRLADLLHRVGVRPGAKAVLFHSFDGLYTESLTLAQAMRPDVLVATSMYGKPVTQSHGGPVRLYVAPMYGYKSLKWLGRIEVSDRVVPGYWERRGYDIDAWVGRSNGRSDKATSP